MYLFFNTLHSILRWLIVLAALFVLIRAATGISFKRGWRKMDNSAGLCYTILLDVQVLIGIILYFFLSPTTQIALQNFGGAMRDSVMRFFAVEHVIGMVIAVVVAHVGRSLVRKIDLTRVSDSKERQNLSVKKHRRAAIWTVISLLIVLASVPWPFLAAGAGRGWF